MQDFTGSEPLLDRPIAFHPCFMPITTKCPIGALFLSQAWYWRTKGRKSNGWIYKTHYHFFEETGLSQKQQIRVRKILCTKPWWEEKVEKVNGVPTYHYRIDRVGLMAEVQANSQKVRESGLAFSENSQRAFSENSQRELSLYKDSENTSIEYSPDPEREDAKEPGEAGKPYSEASPSTNPLETPLNTLDRAIHQQTREEGLQKLLEENQSNITHPLEVDPNPLDGKEGSAAARSTPPDKASTIFGNTRPVVAQKRKAEAASPYLRGLKNPTQRWVSLEDYKKFEAYAIEDARQKRDGEKPAIEGKDYGPIYIETVLRRTADCINETSVDLTIWKHWNLEVAPPPEIIRAPETTEIIPTSPETLALYAQYKIDCAAKVAAREQAARDKAADDAKWGINDEN